MDQNFCVGVWAGFGVACVRRGQVSDLPVRCSCAVRDVCATRCTVLVCFVPPLDRLFPLTPTLSHGGERGFAEAKGRSLCWVGAIGGLELGALGGDWQRRCNGREGEASIGWQSSDSEGGW